MGLDLDSFYSWNRSGDVKPDHNRRVTLYDETLRDGLQSSSVTQPSRIQKIVIIDAINRVGVETACLGFPPISNRIQKDCQAIARYISDNRLSVKSTLVARSLVSDIRSVLTVCDKSGVKSEVLLFLGVGYARRLLDKHRYENVGLNFHGHMDRGLGVINSLSAIASGADRIHACGLGGW